MTTRMDQVDEFIDRLDQVLDDWATICALLRADKTSEVRRWIATHMPELELAEWQVDFLDRAMSRRP